MNFLKLNFITGIFMLLITDLIPKKKKTEREKKQQELEMEKSCEELEEQLSYFIVRPNLSKDLQSIFKCEHKRKLVRLIIMQIPVINIMFFVNMIIDRIKEFKGDKK